MIRVGFAILGSKQWLGGITYLFNLLFAISKLDNENKKIHPIIFLGEKAEKNLVSMYKPYAELSRTSIYDRWHSLWFAHTIFNKVTGSNYFFERVLIKNGVKVFSHALMPIRGKSHYKVIGWIPDFQHIHMREMFSNEEVKRRNRFYLKIAEGSDIIILSSYNALEDLKRFAPAFSSKARVLHFVSQPDEHVFNTDSREDIPKQFGISEKYFFLPNQFWKHKNHQVVFDAVKLLKDRGKNVLLVCSGLMNDYRNKDHVTSLTDFIRLNGLGKNIRLLGMIDTQALFCMMRNCISIVNPSLFEGWSTTVEEAKSLGKNMILSDIAVHREQAPPGVIYFDPNNAEELADILMQKWDRSDGGPDTELETAARGSLSERTRRFGETYQQIIMELCG